MDKVSVSSVPLPPSTPRWLRTVLIMDRAGSSWYIGMGFTFAPLLIILDPWPPVVAAAWIAIGLFGLWLGILGIFMATGLAIILRAGEEVPESYWRSVIDFPPTEQP
ncbi:hypothetical protein DFR67_12155 [Williamsia limnetica]|uniref:Uncharacterized protein n=1 Tax=Williamsia limnetica TaxID=882452 RepID=A0A318RBR6_WILLI|nr:hypothetical protein [Williamsia limnetica]PYE12624.1 hypothetical protein DFR67_12155 [Williamsia limnetica]